jgi:methionine aminopeptidase
MNIHLKTREEIELMRQSCLLVSSTIAEVASHIKPGVTGSKLDAIAETTCGIMEPFRLSKDTQVSL